MSTPARPCPWMCLPTLAFQTSAMQECIAIHAAGVTRPTERLILFVAIGFQAEVALTNETHTSACCMAAHRHDCSTTSKNCRGCRSAVGRNTCSPHSKLHQPLSLDGAHPGKIPTSI